MQFISIDQNSNPLWDVVPKLQALAQNGHHGIHCIEDVDVAFTRRGADADDHTMQIAPERFYRGGVTDWGATLFYSDFLGRTPADPRQLEQLVGLSLKSLGKRLDTDVDGIYERFGDSDNHQLVGPSYLQDRNRHRTIGDLTIAEITPHLNTMLNHAENDILTRFPSVNAKSRTAEWFAKQRAFIQHTSEQLGQHAPLTALYNQWLRIFIPNKNVQTDLTSRLFEPRPENANLAIFDTCIRNHHDFCDAYNAAIDATGEHLTKLKPERGDLPFFAVWNVDNRTFRTECRLDGNRLVTPIATTTIDQNPTRNLARLREHGLRALVGKALVLVLQVRMKPQGAPLALPENGSLYMPTAHRLECELRKRGLLKTELHPVLRVKLGFLDRLAHSGETLTLPEWMQRRTGHSEMTAKKFAEYWRDGQRQAREELEKASHEQGRNTLENILFPNLSKLIEELENKRRQMAQNPETRHRASELWEQIKPLETERMQQFCLRMMDNIHMTNLEYWNSRGATLPWAIAAGGQKWYETEVLAKSEIESNINNK